MNHLYSQAELCSESYFIYYYYFAFKLFCLKTTLFVGTVRFQPTNK